MLRQPFPYSLYGTAMMHEPWARLPALSLKQVQYFVTLAKLRHFTETAQRLAISQPALSSALRQIENVLGGKLINRSAQAVSLTERGALLLPYAERLLHTALHSFDDMQRIMQQGGGGRVRIGLVPSVGALLFPALPEWMAQHYPDLSMSFADMTNDELITAVNTGAVDVGIGILDSTLPVELSATVLREDQFVAVMHRDDPLAAQANLPWRLLEPRDIALFYKGNINLLMMAMIESHRLKLQLRYRVDFLETLYGLARSRLAVAIVPALYTDLLQDDQLRIVHLQQPVVNRTVVLLRRRDDHFPAPIDHCITGMTALLSCR